MLKQLHINITLAGALILIPKYHKMIKALLSNKEKLLELVNTPLNENCSAVILKKLPEKLRDPRKFLILCGFSELKCKALIDLGASINLMSLSVWKKLADFVIVDYESDPRVPLILGRPFLRTIHALINVHREEMILRDGDERLTLNMRHDTLSYFNQPKKESINIINIYGDSSEDFLEKLFTTNHHSGNPTFSSHLKLTSPEVKDDVFDPDQVLKPLFPFPILVEDRDYFLKKSDTSPSYLNNYLPEYETFINHTKETNSGSATTHIFYFDNEEKNSGCTTIHADISLSDLECFNFDFKPNPGELTSIVDSEICENVLSTTNVNLPSEEDHYPLFAYVVWIFLSFLTYLVESGQAK
nr:reverse transcriptase domain-containing protein [Tanacetum cinerariifolium]